MPLQPLVEQSYLLHVRKHSTANEEVQTKKNLEAAPKATAFML